MIDEKNTATQKNTKRRAEHQKEGEKERRKSKKKKKKILEFSKFLFCLMTICKGNIYIINT